MPYNYYANRQTLRWEDLVVTLRQDGRDRRYWTPEFTYDKRDDGTVYMRHVEDLPEHPQLLADYLDRLSLIHI